MEDKIILAIVAVLCITALEITNILMTNIDGAIMITIVTVIAGIAGYQIKAREVTPILEEYKKLKELEKEKQA